jgi:hypothetical protein
MFQTLKLIACCVLVTCIISGCGASKESAYVPGEEAGRQALETALAAWRDGKPMSTINVPDGVAVQPQDSDWKSGKKLVSFSIVKEIPSTEGAKQFSVQLQFQGQPQAIETAYFIVGRDPLWVFRDRDYQRAAGM